MQVPVYRPDSVQQRPVTGQRAVGMTDPAAFGADLAAAGGRLGQAVDQVAKVEHQRLVDFDEATVKDLDNEFAEIERGVLWGNPDQPGALAQTGRNALLAGPSAEEELERKRQEFLARAQGPRQQEMLRRTLEARTAGARDQLSRWQVVQSRQYNIEQSASRVSTMTADAAAASADAKQFPTKMIALDIAVEDLARLTGQDDPDTIRIKKEEARGEVYATVAASMIDTDPAAVVTMLEANAGRMPEKRRLSLLATAKEANATASVLGEADSIWAATGGDYGQAMALAGGQKDPQKRLALESRIGTLQNRDQEVRASAKADLQENLAAQIIAGTTFEELPVADRQRAAALGLAPSLRELSKGTQPESDGPYYQALIAQAAEPGFRSVDLTSPRDDLGGRSLLSMMPAQEQTEILKLQRDGRDRYAESVKPVSDRVMAAMAPQIDVLMPGLKQGERSAVIGAAKAYAYNEVRKAVAANIDIDQGVIDRIYQRGFARTGDSAKPYYFQTRTAALAGQEPQAYLNLRSALTSDGKAPTYAEMDEAIAKAESGKPLVPFERIPVPFRNRAIDALTAQSGGRKPQQRDIELRYNDYLLGR